jgi:WD40 repeat protein
MTYRRIALLAWLWTCAAAPWVDSAAPPVKINRDSLGDALPAGAVARFGTRRLCAPYTTSIPRDLLFTPDGKRLVTTAWLSSQWEDESAQGVCIWDAATGARLGHFGKQKHGVYSAALSPDGKTLAVASPDGVIELWDLRTCKRLRRLREQEEGHRTVSLAFTPGGDLVVGVGRIHVVDVRTGKTRKKYRPPYQGWTEMSLSPDGKLLAFSTYIYGPEKGAVSVLDLTTGARLFTAPAGEGASVAFSPDSTVLASVGHDGLLRLSGAKTGKVLRRWQAWEGSLPKARRVRLAFAPDGKTLASAGIDGSVTVWDPRNGKALRRWPGSYPASYLAYSPDGKVLAGWDLQRVFLRDARTGQPHVRLPGHPDMIDSVAAFAGGDRFASAGSGGVLVWDRRNPFPVASYRPPGGSSRAVSCRGDLVAHQDDPYTTLRVHRGISDRPLAVVPISRYCWATDLSPDGRLLACADNQGTLHLFPLDGKKKARRLSVPFPLEMGCLHFSGVAFSPDGRQVAVACEDEKMRVCDVAAGRWVRTLAVQGRRTPEGDRYSARLLSVAYDPTGLLLAGQGDGNLFFWEAATGELVRRTDPAAELGGGQHSAIRFSPDGRYLACSDGSIGASLWEVRSAKRVGCFRGHEESAVGVCFLDNGRQVLTASRDNTLLLWDRTRMPAGGPVRGGLAGAWEDLQGDAATGHAAVWRLVRTPGAEAFLAGRLARLAPRAPVQARQIDGWIADLGAASFAVRESARQQLLANLEEAAPAVRRAEREAEDLEVRMRLTLLRKQVFARRWSPERLRADRALAALEYLGTAGAKKVLRQLAAGPAGHWLTKEAKAALGRLRQDANAKGR